MIQMIARNGLFNIIYGFLKWVNMDYLWLNFDSPHSWSARHFLYPTWFLPWFLLHNPYFWYFCGPPKMTVRTDYDRLRNARVWCINKWTWWKISATMHRAQTCFGSDTGRSRSRNGRGWRRSGGESLPLVGNLVTGTQKNKGAEKWKLSSMHRVKLEDGIFDTHTHRYVYRYIALYSNVTSHSNFCSVFGIVAVSPCQSQNSWHAM